ncbi:putative O-glycosylation ligase, exosortase A system-associated [Blastomonas sp.]|uniref:putative O-glycosylation ligase, exosortase A system-associated n=1 Tax=Blastomonas sp. TaxID=1909299 RepID=UPI002617573C|nr:putative O-glycosylation ligase, exosortase A system-associated [Blastomonas sp.]MDM7954932.1 putative O-glycosylation ligase, exosortase A system-associated [Blastomonas sp.]
MRDLAFVGFLMAFLALGFKRPFIFVLAYAYVDIVAPQRLSYWMLNAVPVSLIVFGLAFLGWLIADDKRDMRVSFRQGVMALLLAYCAYTTSVADFPVDAEGKWAWVWKALIFAMFLPLTLRTKLRIEALALMMVLCASSIIITGGIKTIASGGGGYGVMRLLVDDNSGLYEGSIISTVAVCIIPLILWLAKFGTIFPTDWRVKGFVYALVFACLLIPVGTQARTGLVCIGVLAVLMLRFVRYRFLYAGVAFALALVAVPFLPQSYSDRMATIGEYQADQSASTRVAVWAWTWNYVKSNPLGGGFEAYLQNKVKFDTVAATGDGPNTQIEKQEITDSGRAYHSSYFEMLGEQGFVGLTLWLIIHLGGIWRMEVVQRLHRKRNRPDETWVVPLALALQNGQIIYMVGSLFVGIAFQPFIYMLIALQIGLDTYLARRRKDAAFRPLAPVKPATWVA